MGCDVHMFAEVNKDGEWVKVENVFKNKYYKPEKENFIDSDGYQWNPEFIDKPYDDRNYDLFSILANVRNGRGFAGVKTGEGFNPISEPKGLPFNVSGEIKQISDNWGCDGHSHSFLTLKELLDYNWNQTTQKQGYLSLREYKEVLNTKKNPESWCGDISGINIIKIDTDEADLFIKKELDKCRSYDKKEIYVLYKWNILYKEYCGDFLNISLPALQDLGNPEEVRIVFWFDN